MPKHLSYMLRYSALILSFLLISPSALADPGDLDVSFNNDGEVVIKDSVSLDMVVLADGSILATGTSQLATELRKYTSDGSLDTSFGGGDGIVIQNEINFNLGRFVGLPGSEILLYYADELGKVTFMRLLSNGSVDQSFGTSGKATIDLGLTIPSDPEFTNITDYPSLTGVEVNAQGQILVVYQDFWGATKPGGGLVERLRADVYMLVLNADGTLNTTFSDDGILGIKKGASFVSDNKAITWLPHGKIAIGLTSSAKLNEGPYTDAIYQYLSDGTLDTTFGTNGKLTLPLGEVDFVYALQPLPQGGILLRAFGQLASGEKIAFVRLTKTGQLDSSYGSNGYALLPPVPVGKQLSIYGLLTLRPDGRVTLGGQIGDGSFTSSDAFVVQYTTNGVLDTSFGTDGKVIFNDYDYNNLWRMSLQGDGKLVVEYDGITYDGAGMLTAYDYIIARLENHALDTTPATFSFETQTDVELNSAVTSGLITVAGLGVDVYAPIMIQNGEFSINGGSIWYTDLGYVINGDQVAVRHTSSGTEATSVETTVSIGGLLAKDNRQVNKGQQESATFTSTTKSSAGDGSGNGSGDNSGSGEDSGGGSLGWLMLTGLALIGFRRRYS